MQNRLTPINSPDNLFHDGDPGRGEMGTIVSADWLNTIQSVTGSLQDEVLTVLQDNSQQADPARKDQLLQAMKKLAWNSTARPSTLTGYGITDGATKTELNTRATQAAPAGEVAHFAMAAAPSGWLKANGAAVSRTQYAELFAAIGTTYGAGDGKTTFNLPDLRGEFVRGWDDGKGVDAGRVFASWQRGSLIPGDNGTDTCTVLTNLGVPGNILRAGLDELNVTTASVYGNALHYFEIGSPVQLAPSLIPIHAGVARPRNLALLACIKY
ncbi:tail fiber protein [Neisseriaceae bacterium TC5R-5]|nr:tail fiber protein [Neisseriaceae bacterium TC5R-5]